jgi:ribosomal protein S20
MGMIRTALKEMEEAVVSKDKEKFKDCLAKLKVYTR